MKNLLTLQEATAAIFKMTGRAFHPATIHIWCVRGVRGVVLQSEILGGRRYTSQEAIDQFQRDLNASNAGQPCQIGEGEAA